MKAMRSLSHAAASLQPGMQTQGWSGAGGPAHGAFINKQSDLAPSLQPGMQRQGWSGAGGPALGAFINEQSDLGHQAESEPKILSELIASDNRLDEPARTQLIEIFQFLGVATVDELMDMSSLGSVSQYLVSGLVRYEEARQCNVTGAVRAALGRIASLATPPSGPANDPALQASPMAQGQHADSTKALLAGLLAGKGDTAVLDTQALE